MGNICAHSFQCLLCWSWHCGQSWSVAWRMIEKWTKWMAVEDCGAWLVDDCWVWRIEDWGLFCGTFWDCVCQVCSFLFGCFVNKEWKLKLCLVSLCYLPLYMLVNLKKNLVPWIVFAHSLVWTLIHHKWCPDPGLRYKTSICNCGDREIQHILLIWGISEWTIVGYFRLWYCQCSNLNLIAQNTILAINHS